MIHAEYLAFVKKACLHQMIEKPPTTDSCNSLPSRAKTFVEDPESIGGKTSQKFFCDWNDDKLTLNSVKREAINKLVKYHHKPENPDEELKKVQAVEKRENSDGGHRRTWSWPFA